MILVLYPQSNSSNILFFGRMRKWIDCLLWDFKNECFSIELDMLLTALCTPPEELGQVSILAGIWLLRLRKEECQVGICFFLVFQLLSPKSPRSTPLLSKSWWMRWPSCQFSFIISVKLMLSLIFLNSLRFWVVSCCFCIYLWRYLFWCADCWLFGFI